jgi:hypothetical protein
MSAEPWPDLNDPGYLRHCLRPDCTASFNMACQMGDGPYVHGWHDVRMFAGGYLCPRHSVPVADGSHKPRWLRDGGEKVIGTGCACEWQWKPGPPLTNGECRDQWAAHLVQVDP